MFFYSAVCSPADRPSHVTLHPLASLFIELHSDTKSDTLDTFSNAAIIFRRLINQYLHHILTILIFVIMSTTFKALQ